VTEADHENPEN